MAEGIIELTDDNFKSMTEKGVVLVDFWATWCAPCKAIAPIIKDIADEYKGKIKVGKLNVDDNQTTASDYGIVSIPTLIYFKDGREADRAIGIVPKSKMRDQIDSLIAE